jgi:hypothetical protein
MHSIVRYQQLTLGQRYLMSSFVVDKLTSLSLCALKFARKLQVYCFNKHSDVPIGSHF